MTNVGWLKQDRYKTKCYTVITLDPFWAVCLFTANLYFVLDMQILPLEKSHSSPGSSKSSSDGQLRSHGPSRSQSKSSVTQTHLEDAGIAIAAAEAAVQQSRLQPSKSFPYPWHASCDMPALPQCMQVLLELKTKPGSALSSFAASF